MKIFISYSDKDKKKMDAVEKAINDSLIDIHPIVVAKDKKPGIPLSDKVRDAIIECDILIPIITKSSILNQWVNQEIGFAFAKEKKIFPIIDKNLLKELKGFIHSNLDIPFSFETESISKYKESYNFRKSYMDLLLYIETIYNSSKDIKPNFTAAISPSKIKQGDNYTTRVTFNGKLKNGFFDNLVRHQESTWKIWNYDRGTLLNSKPTTAGLLHGDINIVKEYSFSTKDWPKGKHTICVRVYDHPIEGEKGRHIVAEEIKEIEIN